MSNSVPGSRIQERQSVAVVRVERQPDGKILHWATHFAYILILAELSTGKICEEQGGRFDGEDTPLMCTVGLILGCTSESLEELYKHWCLDPTLRESELIGLGYSLAVGIFKSSRSNSHGQQSLRTRVQLYHPATHQFSSVLPAILSRLMSYQV